MDAIIGLCIAGGAVVSTEVTAGIYKGTADERELEENSRKIDQYRENIVSQTDLVSEFTALQQQLIEAKNNLNQSKNNFQNGGHVLNNVPLANPEFNSCFKDINNAISSVEALISELSASIKNMEKEVEKLINRNIYINKILEEKRKQKEKSN